MSKLKFAKLSRVSDQELENLFLTGKGPELKELVRQEMRCRTIREKVQEVNGKRWRNAHINPKGSRRV